MNIRMFQGTINACIVMVKRTNEVGCTSDVRERIKRYLESNGLYPTAKDIQQIRFRASLLNNEPQHKVLLGIEPPSDWVDPQVEFLINTHNI